ncbi:MAG TPA: hypothetical protein PKN50_20010, partial [Spirochaetota bacterium]|nr:hypothetical protein [Spirochaetota bacterium]
RPSFKPVPNSVPIQRNHHPPDPRSQDEVDANEGTGCTECVGPEGARVYNHMSVIVIPTKPGTPGSGEIQQGYLASLDDNILTILIFVPPRWDRGVIKGKDKNHSSVFTIDIKMH